MNAKELHDFYFNDLQWCGCGNPEDALKFVGQVLEKIDQRSNDNAAERTERLRTGAPALPHDKSAWAKRSDELIETLLGGPSSMLGLIMMYTLDAHELIEHGGNIMGSWLTPKGEEVLAAIKKHGDGDWFNAQENAE